MYLVDCMLLDFPSTVTNRTPRDHIQSDQDSKGFDLDTSEDPREINDFKVLNEVTVLSTLGHSNPHCTNTRTVRTLPPSARSCRPLHRDAAPAHGVLPGTRLVQLAGGLAHAVDA